MEHALSGLARAHHLPIGGHGAILPFLGAPVGATAAHSLGMLQFGSDGVTWFQTCQVSYSLIACGFLVGVAAYYLVWKYVVGFLNRVLGIA